MRHVLKGGSAGWSLGREGKKDGCIAHYCKEVEWVIKRALRRIHLGDAQYTALVVYMILPALANQRAPALPFLDFTPSPP